MTDSCKVTSDFEYMTSVSYVDNFVENEDFSTKNKHFYDI